MSITIDWASLTTGPSGLALADSIRDFIHDKFQQVALPRFIRSVHVHSFDFGDECPVVELKDISDPLPEFYENEEEEGEDEDGEETEESPSDASGEGEDGEAAAAGGAIEAAPQRPQTQPSPPPAISTRHPALHLRSSGLPFPPPPDQISTPFLSRSNTTTPGVPIPGGTSNLTSYFHLPLSAGFSGTQTPLLLSPWGEQHQQRPPSPLRREQQGHSGTPGFSSNYHVDMAGRHTMTGGEDSSVRHRRRRSQEYHDNHDNTAPKKKERKQKPQSRGISPPPPPPPPPLEDRSQDLQTTLHISYSGTLSLSLTAEILLDYPMPSFVGIPLKLQITGLSFDGVALLAYLRHYSSAAEAESQRMKVHFCFLGREDARAMVGEDGDEGGGGEGEEGLGGLLREIRVESEIGRQEGGKQVLKNVGKVEKFVLEQVRRIFEDEFVWPSFWTFLV